MRLNRTFALAWLLAGCSSSANSTPTPIPAQQAQPAPAPEQHADEPEAPIPEQHADEPEAPPSPQVDLTHVPPGMTQIGDATTAFAARLYDRLKSEPGNLVFSPASITMALGMTYAGARGETATQMAHTLGYDRLRDASAVHDSLAFAIAVSNASQGVQLRVANRLFANRGLAIEGPFAELTRDRYGAPIESLDFAGDADGSRTAINTWVAERTEQRITDLLPSGAITTDTRLVLTNAVYFKGTWRTQFRESATQNLPFTLSGGAQPIVPMMSTKRDFDYARIDDALGGHGLRVLAMPYADESLRMVLAMPERPEDFGALEASIGEITQWMGRANEVEVEVRLPRFRMTTESIPLRRHLEALGMPLPFASTADFTGITNPPSLEDRVHIDQVFHKAFIEVNEEGTEAAAATAVVMARGGRMPSAEEPPRFYADRPFVFAIYDARTNLVLFLGRVVDPR